MAEDKGLYFKKLIQHYFSFDKKNSLKTIALQIVSEFMGGINILLLIPLINLINNNVDNGNSFTKFLIKILSFFGLQPSLISILIFFLTVYILSLLLERTAALINSYNQQKFVTKLRSDFFDDLADSEWNHLRMEHSSSYIKVVTNDINSCGNAINLVMMLFSSILSAFINLFIAVLLSPILSAFGMITVLLLLFIIRKNNNLIFNSGLDIQSQIKDIFNQISDLVNGLKISKMLGLETYQKSVFKDVSEKIEENKVYIVKKQYVTKSVYGILGAVFLCIFIYFGVEYFYVTSTSLLLLILIFSRLTSSFSQIQQNYQRVLSALPNYIDYLQMKEKLKRFHEKSDLGIELEHLSSGIVFENVSFAYNNRTQILKNICLEIPVGKIFTLIGQSGEGKTTIADLLTGLLIPDNGKILIDNTPLNNLNIRKWRQKIGYVPQEGFFFNKSIRNNMLLSNPNVTDEEIWKTLEMASLADFIKLLPDELNTLIGERGNFLSVGERQRMSIAIALIKNPELLILDEATSALDEENEKKIFEIIKNISQAVTVLIITHKKMALEYSDFIYRLEDGIIYNSNI